jgi:site-specific recombinase XerD
MKKEQGLPLVESSNVPTNSLRGRDKAPVSFIVVDGKDAVQSRFGDNIWSFVGGSTNLGPHVRRLDFNPFPRCFVNDVKAIMFHYVREGRTGRTRPTIATTNSALVNVRRFVDFLYADGVRSFDQVTKDHYSAYVESLRRAVTKRGVALSSHSIEKRLLTVELMGEIAVSVGIRMLKPWPGSSAKILSGVPSQAGPRVSKTPIIPEDVLRVLFQGALDCLAGSKQLLRMRDGVAKIKSRSSRNGIYCQRKYLESCGWTEGVAALTAALVELRTACYIIVATLSGCRNHEIGHIKNGSYFSSVSEEGHRAWWFRSKSTKTRIGTCDWMVPRLAVDALEVMENWSRPLQQELEREIERRRIAGSSKVALAEAVRHKDALFLCRTHDGVRTMSAANMRAKLNAFARCRGVRWLLATHQFRRTFAVYAARSSFGDLRYLKEHFKHWSMDMTLLYAAGGLQEKDLLDEVADELQEIQLGVTSLWLEPDTKLAGGAARRIKRFREDNPIRMYSSRATMVEMLSGEVHLRSNGHAWCTADDGSSCIGSTSLDGTRCIGCSNSVIGSEHALFYSSMRNDLEGLLEIEDIGSSGRARILRDLTRCDAVLRELGQNAGDR